MAVQTVEMTVQIALKILAKKSWIPVRIPAKKSYTEVKIMTAVV